MHQETQNPLTEKMYLVPISEQYCQMTCGCDRACVGEQWPLFQTLVAALGDLKSLGFCFYTVSVLKIYCAFFP